MVQISRMKFVPVRPYPRTVMALLTHKENRIYIKVEFRKSLGMNLFSPFQPEREIKV